MAIRKFTAAQYDTSNTMGLMTHRLMPITSTDEEQAEVYSISVFNNIVNPNTVRVVSEQNLNQTIEDIEGEFVAKSTTVNGKSLTGNIQLAAGDVGAEPAFSKNSAFNKSFGTTAGTVCQGDDARLSNSRPCNSTFDDAAAARTNLGLHAVASSGNYNDLANKPYIPSNYVYYNGIFHAALAGFSGLTELSASSSTLTKTLDRHNKYCFVGYGGYTAGMIMSISGGSWSGESLSYASDVVIIPKYTGSMAGSTFRFLFITNSGIYEYISSTGTISLQFSRPDCYAWAEVQYYSYY